MTNPTILPAIAPGVGCFDCLRAMDEETLDALSELMELKIPGTGIPVIVLPKEPHILH